jgi:glycosyltransferase involved in cell wall biosynthesis
VLARLGHEVTLITAFPSYPLGRIYDAYRGKLWRRDSVAGVDVLRVWSLAAPNSGIVHRMLSFCTFALAAAVAGLRQGPVDVVIGSVPKPFTEFAAWLVARFRKATFVVELRDLLPDSLLIAGFSKTNLGYRLLDRYYRWLYRRVDIFAVASEWMTPQLRARSGDHIRTVHLPHSVDQATPHKPRAQLRAELGCEHRFLVTYAGSFSPYYRVPLIAAAAELLLQSQPAVSFLFIGTGADFAVVQDRVRLGRLHNVILLGGIEPQHVTQYLQASDLFVRPQFLPDLTDGTKIVEYLAAGKPIVNVCIHMGAKGQAENYGIGLSVSPESPTELADAIAFYANHPEQALLAGAGSANLVRGRLERGKVVAHFAAKLEAVVAMKRRAP